jgi:hypothetical protein
VRDITPQALVKEGRHLGQDHQPDPSLGESVDKEGQGGGVGKELDPRHLPQVEFV